MKSYLRAVLGRAMPTGRREKAFTLIELLIVIAIIAILTVAFLPGALKAPAKARDAQRIKSVQDISAAVESYSAERSGTLPVSALGGTIHCLTFGGGADLAVLATYFPNNTFPIDPRPVGDGACGIGGANTAFYYRVFGRNYAVGAKLELQASGNTTASVATAVAAATTFANLQAATVNAAGGTAGASVIPNVGTPVYLYLGT